MTADAVEPALADETADADAVATPDEADVVAAPDETETEAAAPDEAEAIAEAEPDTDAK